MEQNANPEGRGGCLGAQTLTPHTLPRDPSDVTPTRLFFTTFARKQDRAGKLVAVSFGDLAARVQRPRLTVASKADLPLWGFFQSAENYRTKEAIRRLSCGVIDVDGDAMAMHERLASVGARLGSPLPCIAHTSPSDGIKAGGSRYRVVVPLSRPVTVAEYPRAMAPLARLFEGANVDPCWVNPAQIFFVPGRIQGREHAYACHVQAPTVAHAWLDVGELLAMERDHAAAQARRITVVPLPSRAVSHAHAEQVVRAEKYARSIDPSIQGSNGSAMAMRAVARLFHAFPLLTEADAFTLLQANWNPRCTPPWSPRELQKKVKDACNGAMRAPKVST